MWQIRATFFNDTSYLLWSFLFRVLSHLVLAVLAFIWGCSRAQPKMAAAAAWRAGHRTGLRWLLLWSRRSLIEVGILVKLVAKRIGLFSWRRQHIADAAVERECHCALGFVALAGEPPILCRGEKS